MNFAFLLTQMLQIFLVCITETPFQAGITDLGTVWSKLQLCFSVVLLTLPSLHGSFLLRIAFSSVTRWLPVADVTTGSLFTLMRKASLPETNKQKLLSFLLSRTPVKTSLWPGKCHVLGGSDLYESIQSMPCNYPGSSTDTREK